MSLSNEQNENPSNEEPKYFTTTVMIKVNEAKNINIDTLWDAIENYLPECEGETDEDGNTLAECTCGIESMSGRTGTADQCWDYLRVSEKWAEVHTADLKAILSVVDIEALNPEQSEAYNRLVDEAYWHDNFQTWMEENLEDEEEEEDGDS